jgi:hypothetical protein
MAQSASTWAIFAKLGMALDHAIDIDQHGRLEFTEGD